MFEFSLSVKVTVAQVIRLARVLMVIIVLLM